MKFFKQHSHNFFISLTRMFNFLHVAWRLHPLLVTIWIILLLVASLFPAMEIWLYKESINSISNIGINKSAFKLAIILIIILYLTYIFNLVFELISNYIFTIITDSVNFSLKRQLFKKSIITPLEYFESGEYYNQIKLASLSIEKNGVTVINFSFIIIQQFISLIAIYGLLSSVHWSLPFALLFSSLPGMIILFIAKKRQFILAASTTKEAREMDYTSHALIDRLFAREIKIFKLGSHLISRWGSLFQKVRKLSMEQVKYESKGRFTGGSILQISGMIVAIILVVQINNGNVTIGDYVALLGAVATVQGIFGNIGGNLSDIFELNLFNNALFKFLDSNVEEKKPKINCINLESSNINVNNLSFAYPLSKEYVLNDISFSIKRGETIGIVGENGAGKSTLINCLMGLFTISKGSIYYGDTEVSMIDPEMLRKQFSVVFQDFIKYKYSLRENVGFGKLSELYNDNLILDCLKEVGMDEKIAELSKGLDTQIGKEFDGEELSGGEWQRIAIARSILSNAEILVLDEPTSALDPNIEVEVFNRFQDLTKDKTSIMISHRLGPVKHADRILVLHKGMLVEQGTHDELIALKGKYYTMYTAQAQWYTNQPTNDNERSYV